MSAFLRIWSRPRRAARSASRAYRAARAVAFVSLELALAGCSASPTQRAVVLPESARAAFAEGCAAEADGRIDEAVPRYREAVLAAPQFVSAHRSLQNLEIARHQRGELLVRYAAWRDAAPDSAERWYLYGRVCSDLEAERAAFERAHELDPDCPWPYLGLGQLRIEAHDFAGAIARFEKGLRLAPGQSEFVLALARARLASGDRQDEVERLLGVGSGGVGDDVPRALVLAGLREHQHKSFEATTLLGALLARHPENRELANALITLLDRSGRREDAVALREQLESPNPTSEQERVFAACDVLAGDVPRAIERWERGTPSVAAERALRRRWLVSSGDCERAVELERVRFRALAELGFAAPAFDDAERLAAEHERSVAQTTALAAAFSRLGWVEEALAVLRPLRGTPLEDAHAKTLERSLFAQRRLEAELRVIAEETYRASDAGLGSPSLDEFLHRLGEAARRALGDDLIDGTDRIDFFPVGELIDPASERGLPGYFRASGRLMVAGKRVGHPPELLLMPVVASATAGPQHALLCFTEGVRIPSYLQHQGASLSGAALSRFAYVDLAAIEDEVERLLELERRLGPAVDRVERDPAQPAADAGTRRAVAEPADVATKLLLRALRESRARGADEDPSVLLAEALDGVLQHEIGHLEDAERFLPLSRRVWANLGVLVALRFSPKRIEEWLEMRAECVALARARNPHLVLAAAASLDGDAPSALTPHGAGYRELLARLVRVADEDGEAFPELDRSKVLVQQLDRLSGDQIRLAARRVLRELGIDEPESERAATASR